MYKSLYYLWNLETAESCYSAVHPATDQISKQNTPLYH